MNRFAGCAADERSGSCLAHRLKRDLGVFLVTARLTQMRIAMPAGPREARICHGARGPIHRLPVARAPRSNGRAAATSSYHPAAASGSRKWRRWRWGTPAPGQLRNLNRGAGQSARKLSQGGPYTPFTVHRRNFGEAVPADRYFAITDIVMSDKFPSVLTAAPDGHRDHPVSRCMALTPCIHTVPIGLRRAGSPSAWTGCRRQHLEQQPRKHVHHRPGEWLLLPPGQPGREGPVWRRPQARERRATLTAMPARDPAAVLGRPFPPSTGSTALASSSLT
jgi:hypothetical protein